jgi:hypothetical protein
MFYRKTLMLNTICGLLVTSLCVTSSDIITALAFSIIHLYVSMREVDLCCR